MWSLHSTTQVFYDGKGTHLKLKRPGALDQWLSTLFVLVHTFKFARKPVHPRHALKSGAVKV